MSSFLLFLASYTIQFHALNLTYGRLKFDDTAVAFDSLQEYHLFLDSNNMSEIDEPGYLVKCVEANTNKWAACLDGTPQAFYYRPGYAAGANKFVIYLHGGGWCAGIDETVSPACGQTCAWRAQHSDLGTSANDEPYLYFGGDTHGGPSVPGEGYISNQQKQNPLSYNWNTVFVRYCDGASFSGLNRTTTMTQNGNELYFKGFNNLEAVLTTLLTDYGLLNASDVLLTGPSAGGLAVYLHADYIAGFLNTSRDINFMAMPDSGFFLDYEGAGEYDMCMRWLFDYQNTSIALNEQCVKEQTDAHKCMFAQYTVPYIESRVLALQSRFDTYQTGSELRSNDTADINTYGNVLMETVLQSFEGCAHSVVFLDSCAHHTGLWGDIVIGGQNAVQVQLDFWNSNRSASTSAVYFQDEAYPCDECCSPKD